MPHPNLILCWQSQEGQGTVTRDSSPSGVNGTLTGGPAWVNAPRPEAIYSNNRSSNTLANWNGWVIDYPGTDGVKVESAATELFDFSGGGKPFIAAITMQMAEYPNIGFRSLFSFSAGGADGWEFEISNASALVFYFIGVAGSAPLLRITDTNPHRLGIAFDGVNTVRGYLDGKFISSFSGMGAGPADSSGGKLAISGTTIASGSVWKGKANNAVVYNFIPSGHIENTDAFMLDEYLYWQGIDGPKEIR